MYQRTASEMTVPAICVLLGSSYPMHVRHPLETSEQQNSSFLNNVKTETGCSDALVFYADVGLCELIASVLQRDQAYENVLFRGSTFNHLV
jgi:hypothetical protein